MVMLMRIMAWWFGSCRVPWILMAIGGRHMKLQSIYFLIHPVFLHHIVLVNINALAAALQRYRHSSWPRLLADVDSLPYLNFRTSISSHNLFLAHTLPYNLFFLQEVFYDFFSSILSIPTPISNVDNPRYVTSPPSIRIPSVCSLQSLLAGPNLDLVISERLIL
ncbi:hypothetical protein QBC38DRAFT_184505 [Podospora fimiseda]|uniref:Uncharacterized protein n=1 Tax=Podospora fimiseda TaxID=252190 RepID=A0AAN7BQK3_9PEZI|nr:hypothetical protein QBC38DRAFT_184505 [Podospora fimiseda]